jgi:hypothetical protein
MLSLHITAKVCEFNSRPCRMYLILLYMIKLFSDLWQVNGFLHQLRVRVMVLKPLATIYQLYHCGSTNKTEKFNIDVIVFISIQRHNVTSHWPIFFSIRVSPLIQTISLGEIKEKMSNLLMVVNFIIGENLSTRRKPSICRKSLTNFIT